MEFLSEKFNIIFSSRVYVDEIQPEKTGAEKIGRSKRKAGCLIVTLAFQELLSLIAQQFFLSVKLISETRRRGDGETWRRGDKATR